MSGQDAVEVSSEAHINVLDAGFVRLIDSMGNDLSVVRAARVSHDADWRAGESDGSDRRLIAYLLKNRHTSPFEHVTFTFEVQAPIFIFRQWHRHRTWSFNEISARYTELDLGYYLPNVENIGAQSKVNKQARDIREMTADELEAAVNIRSVLQKSCQDSFLTYRELLNYGTPREVARLVLPVAAYSRMFATIDLHNLLHFLTLRTHSHSQWEIQQYALAVLKLVTPIVPHTIEVWKSLNSPFEA